jgi:L-lactate dehydrogenase
MTLYDPSAFAGADEFTRQTDWIAESCRTNPPAPGLSAVRMPGDRGMASKARQVAEGVELHPTIPPMLMDCAQRYGVSFPSPIDG